MYTPFNTGRFLSVEVTRHTRPTISVRMFAGSSTERSRAKVGNSGEIARVERVQAKRRALARDGNLALGQLELHRRVRKGLHDVGEHLAGDDDLPLLVNPRGDAVANGDGVVGGLEFKDPVGGARTRTPERMGRVDEGAMPFMTTAMASDSAD